MALSDLITFTSAVKKLNDEALEAFSQYGVSRTDTQAEKVIIDIGLLYEKSEQNTKVSIKAVDKLILDHKNSSFEVEF